MIENWQSITEQIYKNELTFPHLQERLQRGGELRAWYKYYRGGNQWAGKHFMEENVFLMEKVLVWMQIAEDGKMGIYSFKLDDISKIDRSYTFADKSQEKLVLSQATITFKTMKDNRKRDTLVFKRPLPAEQGDVEGFEQLIALLD
ncbi:MAG: hypothetical protein PHP26_07430 [Syntrophomonas sp.]|nr:hypothetical protein [Syntrophomonas sp.]MDD3879807.1 hypothetical protein [Syntrophomonas sp.]